MHDRFYNAAPGMHAPQICYRSFGSHQLFEVFLSDIGFVCLFFFICSRNQIGAVPVHALEADPVPSMRWPIRIHHQDEVAYAAAATVGAGITQQPLDHAYHAPLGIMFAGMLISKVMNPPLIPGIGTLGVCDFKTIDVSASERFS